MNKKQSIIAVVMALLAASLLFLTNSLQATNIIKPLDEENVKLFLQKLNDQGEVVSFDKNIREDKIIGYDLESSSFGLDGSPGSWYFLYKADINNDGIEEYVLCSASGSGGFFDIDAVYQERNGVFVNIFDEIKLPMRKLIRDAEKEDYDLEEGYSGFMNGSIAIEQESDNKVYFTLWRVTRKYEGKGYEEDFNPPQRYKFLWNNGEIQLIEYDTEDVNNAPISENGFLDRL